MTIDEVIQIEKYYGKKDKKALEELQNNFPMIDGIMDNNLHEQIAEWLKELKELRNAIHCNAFTYGYEKGSKSMAKECNNKIKDIEEVYKEKYGCNIIEMYADVVCDFREWLTEYLVD